MRAGPKPKPPSLKKIQGTYRPDRDGHVIEVTSADALPMQPDWLTAAGQEIWLDEIGRTGAGHFVTERDTTMFATFCNLQGAIVMAWRAGEVPPAAHLMEARKMAEQFGIFGAKSRLLSGGGDGAKSKNPFSRRGVRTG